MRRAVRPTPTTKDAAVAKIAAHPMVKQAFATLEKENAWTLDQQVSLCEIPAPPFKEAARAAAFRDRLVALGVQQVRIDREGNVIGELRGARPRTNHPAEWAPRHRVPGRDQCEGEA